MKYIFSILTILLAQSVFAAELNCQNQEWNLDLNSSKVYGPMNSKHGKWVLTFDKMKLKKCLQENDAKYGEVYNIHARLPLDLSPGTSKSFSFPYDYEVSHRDLSIKGLSTANIGHGFSSHNANLNTSSNWVSIYGVHIGSIATREKDLKVTVLIPQE